MISVGIDIVDNQRIEKMLTKSFINKFLSDEEQEDYDLLPTIERKVEFIAGRIAAKEAVLKCLKTKNICSMKDIIIRDDEWGAPFVTYGEHDIQISISHEKIFSIAIALYLR